MPVVFNAVTVLDRESRAIAARLSIFGSDRLPGRETDAFLVTSPDRPPGLSLLPGSYSVRVLPVDSALYPGIDIRSWLVRESGQSVRREFVLPPSYRTLSGEVVLRTSATTKVSDVEVRARSTASGLPSTVALSDQAGHFALSLPESEETTFLLSASPRDSLVPAWGYEQVITVSGESRSVTIELEATTDSIRGESRLRVLGLSDHAPEPVADATVTFTATTSLASRVFRASGVTDEQGYVSVRSGDLLAPIALIAARYVVTVDPPPSSAFRRRQLTLDLSDIGPSVIVDKQIELGLRTLLTGTLRSSRGTPVAAAAVQLVPANGARQITAATDSAGTFSARVDPGSYLLRIEPARGSSQVLPVAFEAVIVADAPSVELPPITLPSGAILEGTVIGDADGALVERATVEAFVVDQGRSISLGHAETGKDGVFRLILPQTQE